MTVVRDNGVFEVDDLILFNTALGVRDVRLLQRDPCINEPCLNGGVCTAARA